MPQRPAKKAAAKARKPKLIEPHKLDGFYIAAGGDYVEATLLDTAGAAENVERVHVKLLEEAAYQIFFEKLDGSAYDFADFICKKEPGWSRRFHPLSAQLIKARGIELNFTSAQQWADNQMAVVEGMVAMEGRRPETVGTIKSLMEKGSPSSNGATGSPAS